MKTKVWNPDKGTRVYGVEGLSRVLSRGGATRTLGLEQTGVQRTNVSTEQCASCLVLDRSGSMDCQIGHGDARTKIDGAREAATSFICNSPAGAQVAVVGFSCKASVLVPLSEASKGKLSMIDALQGLTADGTTAMHAALAVGRKETRKAPRGHTKRIFCLTDGLPDSYDSAVAEAERAKKEGIQITAIGFGDGRQIDEDLMKVIASTNESGQPMYWHFRDHRSLTMFLTRASRTLIL